MSVGVIVLGTCTGFDWRGFTVWVSEDSGGVDRVDFTVWVLGDSGGLD